MKGEKFTFSEQIKTHEHGAGIFLEYQDNDEGAEKLVVYVPYSSISTGVSSKMFPDKIDPLGYAKVVHTCEAFKFLKPGQKPLQEDKFHRSWAHKMHDKWKTEQLTLAETRQHALELPGSLDETNYGR